jgi:hypothetical protein
MRKESRALRDLREPPEGLKLDLYKANDARKKRVGEIAARLGIDPKILRETARSTEQKLTKALGTPAGKVTPGFNLARNFERWAALSPLHKYPLNWGVHPPVDLTDPNRWQIYFPPFPWWNLHFESIESDNFTVTRDFTLLENIGAVGNLVKMDCNDAGDFDLAHGIEDTQVVFVYEAPASGRLEVIVDASNQFGHNDLRIEDEWGWSDHWTDQHNYLCLQVFHPVISEPSLALMWDFYREGNDDHTWSERALTPGQHYYGHMVSNGSVAKGETFFVGVGTRTFDITRANDVEVHSKSQFLWVVNSVEVRIVT